MQQQELKPRKYYFVNGVMKLNPNFPAPPPAPKTKSTAPAPVVVSAPSVATTEPLPQTPSPVLDVAVVEPLQVISSLDDLLQAVDAQADDTGVPMQLAASAVQAIDKTQGDEYISQLNGSTAAGNQIILEGLTNVFTKYSIPIGMMNKLQALSSYRLNFIIDDSGSMRYESLSNSVSLDPPLILFPCILQRE
jgi:hypothetical protein